MTLEASHSRRIRRIACLFVHLLFACAWLPSPVAVAGGEPTSESRCRMLGVAGGDQFAMVLYRDVAPTVGAPVDRFSRQQLARESFNLRMRLAAAGEKIRNGDWDGALDMLEDPQFAEGSGITHYDVTSTAVIPLRLAERLAADPELRESFFRGQAAKSDSGGHAGLWRVRSPRFALDVGQGLLATRHPLLREINRERARLIVEEVGHHLQRMNALNGSDAFVSRQLSQAPFRRELEQSIRAALAQKPETLMTVWLTRSPERDFLRRAVASFLKDHPVLPDGGRLLIHDTVRRLEGQLAQGDVSAFSEREFVELQSIAADFTRFLKAEPGYFTFIVNREVNRQMVEADIYYFVRETLGAENVPDHWIRRYVGRVAAERILRGSRPREFPATQVIIVNPW